MDRIFTAILGKLMHAELMSVHRISQHALSLSNGDGLRVRASAGTGSFRTRPTLGKCLAEAEADLKKKREEADTEQSDEQDRTVPKALAYNIMHFAAALP